MEVEEPRLFLKAAYLSIAERCGAVDVYVMKWSALAAYQACLPPLPFSRAAMKLVQITSAMTGELLLHRQICEETYTPVGLFGARCLEFQLFDTKGTLVKPCQVLTDPNLHAVRMPLIKFRFNVVVDELQCSWRVLDLDICMPAANKITFAEWWLVFSSVMQDSDSGLAAPLLALLSQDVNIPRIRRRNLLHHRRPGQDEVDLYFLIDSDGYINLRLNNPSYVFYKRLQVPTEAQLATLKEYATSIEA